MPQVSLSPTVTPAAKSARLPRARATLELVLRLVCGSLIVGGSTWLAAFYDRGWQPLGALLGIALVVCSLFGDLPPWIAWAQRLGQWLYPGLALGCVALLVPFLVPTSGHESAFIAFSPQVWLAYISIVLVGISFERSALPGRIYHIVQRWQAAPWLVMPPFVLVAGLLGNILDGVSIMAISVVIFLSLLPLIWATRASFALLFGGLISNLITVAAEPTNIKFQDVLGQQLDRVAPSYWFTNWPISLLGILVPTIWLGYSMAHEQARWREREPATLTLNGAPSARGRGSAGMLSIAAPLLLAGGIIAHTTLITVQRAHGVALDLPLWPLLLPAGIVASIHLLAIGQGRATGHQLREDSSVWLKLALIFSLLWFLANALTSHTNVFAAFFSLPETMRYSSMVVLSLLSSITDNVALAAMQGSLLLRHPLDIWQVRLLFILLTWAGGFTPFGCLQSLAVNSRLNLSTGAWFREARQWGITALIGGLAGLAVILVLYPTTTGLPH